VSDFRNSAFRRSGRTNPDSDGWNKKSFWGRFLDLLFGERKPDDSEFVPLPRPYLWILRINALALVPTGLLWVGSGVGMPVIGSWGSAIGGEKLKWALWVCIGVNFVVQLRHEHLRNRQREKAAANAD